MLTIRYIESDEQIDRDLALERAADLDIERVAIIATLALNLENANRAITQLAATWPTPMRDAADDIVRAGNALVERAREAIA